MAGGSNLAPEHNLRLAAQQLMRLYPDVRFSAVYRNAAVGFEGPEFWNFVACFTSAQPPGEVLAQLHRIEELCGRARDAPKWAPRSMDLDILLYDDVVGEWPGLVLPRPDLLRRAYMLGPLAQIAPQLVHPLAHCTMAELWRRFDQAAHPLVRVDLDLATSRCSGPHLRR
jgi:2-amino-4-hydroxy-6-hydroxymethyldihydropteridine diphosphokinase